uniref:Uncharacterized protein n=1 Tax=Ditylenchus dipsaci TaxID=166011 RepID=A0A915E0K0_9BILA
MWALNGAFQHYSIEEAIAASCEGHSIAVADPSLVALANGQPILGCARPGCFGWNADGKRSADSAQFYRVGKVADGYLRSSDAKGPIVKNATGFRPQYSICDQSYISDHCSDASWVGGLAPTATIEPKNALKLMCCSYNKLSESVDEGRVEIRPGQVIKGGEVKNSQGRQSSFEYIANVQRLFDRNGVVYILTMKKFPCVPEPIALISGIESDTADFLIDNINAMSETKQSEITAITPKALFNDQKFDLPNDMPQEQTNRKSEDVPQSLNAVNRPLTRVRLGIPSAKPMVDDVVTVNTEVAMPPNKVVYPVDAKATDYQKTVLPANPNQQISSMQKPSQTSNSQSSLPSNQQYSPNQSQQYNNNQQRYPYSQTQSQQQSFYDNQQATMQAMQSMLDPLGMFRNLAPFPSARLAAQAAVANGISTYKGEHPNNSAAMGPKANQQYEVVEVVDSEPVNGFSMPRIPTPEEIENALPPASKRLIATVTNLLGYNRFV